jgi:NTE family protein
VKGEKLFAKHLEVVGKQNIEDFPIPFTAVATDMKHNEEVHFKSGDLYKALRASVSIPGFFVPVVDHGRVLVDGGVLNPLPINLVDKEEDEIIVAVNLNGRYDPKYDKKPEPDRIDEMKKWFHDLLPESMKDNRKVEVDPEEDSFSLIELMDSTFSFTQDRLTRLMIEVYKPDYLIEIPRNSSGIFDFDQAKKILEVGRKSYHEVIDSPAD